MRHREPSPRPRHEAPRARVETAASPAKWVALSAILLLAAAVLWVTGCSTVYYSIWETLGKEKRDLLRDNVEEVQRDQEQVGEQFEDTLERLRALYGTGDEDLEAKYDKVKTEYDQSVARSDALRARIDQVRDIGEDLFAEWQVELDQISDPKLRSASRQQLGQTKQRFAKLEATLATTEAGLDPVLQRFQDQVLFLKHNLNAQAVGNLRAEVGSIEREVDDLVADLQRSIREADRFIQQLP